LWIETPRNPLVSTEKEKHLKLSESSEDLADNEDLDATIIEMENQTPISSQELGMELYHQQRRRWSRSFNGLEYRDSSGEHPSRQGGLGCAGKDVHQATS